MKRYVITSATPGCTAHEPFLQAIQNYCRKHKATHLIIPTVAISKKAVLDPVLSKYGTIVMEDTKLNNKLVISTIPIGAEQPDPVAGLERLFGIDQSVIYSSPKQRLKSVASPSNDLPRVIMTPGSVTRPHKKASKRALISNLDHVMGAIIVEVEGSTIYHFRQTQADRDGSFIDLGVKYASRGKPEPAKVSAVIPGDWHTGYTDPAVRSVVVELLKKFNPSYLIFHDLFDGISVNHHIEHKYLMKALLGAQNSLTAELQVTANELAFFEKLVKKEVVVVKSNHDEFVDRWLDSGGYLTDSTNHIIGLELALAKANGKDPLEYGVAKYTSLNKTRFLKSDESFKISRKEIECGMHGHLGVNGARGSTASLEKAYLLSISGHTHSPEIQRGAWVVGTSSYLKLNYNRGPSSWMHTLCIVYENGARQLINVIRGKWQAVD
jgi:predicted phosphodiesterase